MILPLHKNRCEHGRIRTVVRLQDHVEALVGIIALKEPRLGVAIIER